MFNYFFCTKGSLLSYSFSAHHGFTLLKPMMQSVLMKFIEKDNVLSVLCDLCRKSFKLFRRILEGLLPPLGQFQNGSGVSKVLLFIFMSLLYHIFPFFLVNASFLSDSNVEKNMKIIHYFTLD